MIIHLIRHGKSQWQTNEVNPTVVGDSNVTLSNEGWTQAKQLGARLGHRFVSDSLLFTSPYMRARQTLYGIIDGSQVAVHAGVNKIYEDPRLRESEFGYNKEPDQIKTEKGVRDDQGYFYYRYQGGESPADVYDRVSTFIDTMTRQMERKRVFKSIIVSHGITIRCFVMRFMHLTVEQFDMIKNPDNCDLITIAPLESRAMKNVTPQFKSGRWGVCGLSWREKPITSEKRLDKIEIT